jgi:hypothetical protein
MNRRTQDVTNPVQHLQSQQQNAIDALCERLVERSEPGLSVAERERLDREIDSLALAARDCDVPWARIALVLHMSEAEAVKFYGKQ